ncbi:MAG: prolipoprotein diacylglyceryl transferase [Bacteroidia bacterium]
MYPSLYYLFDDLFGIKLNALKALQMFGAMVAISFLAASYFLSKELKRKEKEGLLHAFTEKIMTGEKASLTELLEAFVIAFIVGYKGIFIALNWSDFLNDTQGFILSWKGNLLGGIALGGIYAYLRYREKEKHRLPEPKLVEEQVHPYQLVGNITLIAAGGGLLGAKLFDGLENYKDFFQHPSEYLFSFSGLTMYGGLIVGALSVLYYTHRKGLSILHTVDAAAPSIMIAYAIGRIGCQLAGDGDWGIPNPAPKPGWMSFLPNWMWSFDYPHNVSNAGHPIPGCMDVHCSVLDVPVFPTPFYETTMCAVLFLILWVIRKKIKAPGVLFCIYLAMNGVERFLIELIRVNIKYDIFGLKATQAQLISPILFLLGIYGIYYFNKKAKANEQIVP